MKLSIIVPVLNQFDISLQAIKFLSDNLDKSVKTEIIIIDNGSSDNFHDLICESHYQMMEKFHRVIFHRNDQNIGNYPVFKQGLELSSGEIIAYFHSDLFVYEQSYNKRISDHFDSIVNLGLSGFIGSNQICGWGGRGLGTMSNFQGKQIGQWKGSPAQAHGKTIHGSEKALMLDGCSMIFRRSALEKVGFRDDFPIHHFYDRLLSLQIHEAGFDITVLGIPCDHISGQTANKECTYHDSAKKWFMDNLGIENPIEWRDKFPEWVADKTNHPPVQDGCPNNWDHATYVEAERQFLQEYKFNKKLVPLNL